MIRGVEAYRTPDDRFDRLPDYPFAPHYIDQDGLRMHYVDEGGGRPVLLLHGEPTWSFLYRKIIPPVSAVARTVAPDLFGFGRSDKPLSLDDYSYDFHCRTIERFVDELDLRDTTVVVQDWGGPIGLRLAATRPDRFSRAVIMNTAVGAGRAPSETWLRFRELVRAAGTDLQAGRLVRVSCRTAISDEVEQAYDAPFPVPEAKAGMLAFPELVPTDPGHPTERSMLAAREAIERWEGETLVLFSDSDPIFSTDVGQRWVDRLANALPLEIVEGAGHMLQEDAGEQIGERIARFVA